MPEIKRTQVSDIPHIRGIFDAAIRYQQEKGFPIWPVFDEQLLHADASSGNQYKVLVEGHLGAVFTLSYAEPIIWQEREQGDAIYLNRMAVSPLFKGHRLFGEIRDWAWRHTRETGRRFLRMDTWADNPNLIHYYQQFGFTIPEERRTGNSEEIPHLLRNNYVVLLEFRPEQAIS